MAQQDRTKNCHQGGGGGGVMASVKREPADSFINPEHFGGGHGHGDIDIKVFNNIVPAAWDDVTHKWLKRLKVELRATSGKTAALEEELKAKEQRLSYLEQMYVDMEKRRAEDIRIVIQEAQTLDLAFLVDATGSMGP